MQKTKQLIKANSIWYSFGNNFSKTDKIEVFPDGLPNGIYKGNVGFGINFEHVGFKFELPEKIYGIEKEFIEKVKISWENSKSNLGILLSGSQGTGKTITSKIIANEINAPVLVIAQKEHAVDIINEIDKDIVVFIDEYDKIFEDSADLLSIMDGANASSHRRLFIFTTNETRLNPYLINRPSRIKYHKRFSDNLSDEVIKEIIDDRLMNFDHKEDLLSLLKFTENISIDNLKSIIDEVNLFDRVESQEEFFNTFNVNKCDVYTIYGKLTDVVNNLEFKFTLENQSLDDANDIKHIEYLKVGKSYYNSELLFEMAAAIPQLKGRYVGESIACIEIDDYKRIYKFRDYKPKDDILTKFSNQFELEIEFKLLGNSAMSGLPF